MNNPTPLLPYPSIPKIIGITGGIGSGKSTIARELASRGYRLYDTDREAKRLIVEDYALRAQIEALLGSDVYEGNTYRTDLVAQRVFSNPDLLRRLNALVHPAVRRDIEHLTASIASSLSAQRSFCPKGGPSGVAGLIIESALLFETGLDDLCDLTICVTAPENIRIARTMVRDHVSEEQVRARIASQMSEQERAQKADRVLINDGKMSISALIDALFL